jgi:hypothetical protein
VKCYAVASIFRRNLWPALAFPSMPIEFYFTPELHLRDGRIRDLDDAISFAREQRLDQEPSVQGCANKETIKFFQSLRLGRRYGVLPLLPRPSHAGRGWHDSPRTLPRPVAQSASDGPSRQGYALITGCCLERSLARYSEGKGGL